MPARSQGSSYLFLLCISAKYHDLVMLQALFSKFAACRGNMLMQARSHGVSNEIGRRSPKVSGARSLHAEAFA